MNTEPEVVGTHHGVNLYPIPGYPIYCATKCGKVFSTKHQRWLNQHLSQSGYPRVCLQLGNGRQRTIKVHKVMALAFFHGAIGEVDHANRVKADNRLINLRLVTRSQNMHNRIFNGTQKRGNRWVARIWCGGKRVSIGTFPTEEEARFAYLSKKLELGLVLQ